MNTSFFGELLQSIAERGRSLLDRTRDRRESAERRSASIIELSEQLLSGRGEASGVALAAEILAHYAELTSGPRIAFFEALAARFGPDHDRLKAAIDAWRSASSDVAAAKVHAAAEPRRQELLRRLNLAPGGTAALVRMREQLLDAVWGHARAVTDRTVDVYILRLRQKIESDPANPLRQQSSATLHLTEQQCPPSPLVR